MPCRAVPCRAVPEGAVLRAWESHLQSHMRSCFSAKSRQIKTDTPERAHMEFGNTDRGLTHPERLIHVHGPGRPLAPSRAPCSDLFARPASWSISPQEWLQLGGFAWQVGSHLVWQYSRGMFPHSTPVLHAMAMVYAFHAHVFPFLFPFLHSHGSEATAP